MKITRVDDQLARLDHSAGKVPTVLLRRSVSVSDVSPVLEPPCFSRVREVYSASFG
jgi:hypothetical protein